MKQFADILKPILNVAILYALGCIVAVPKGNEADYLLTTLPKPLAVILFFPTVLFGIAEFYIFGVVWQVYFFLFETVIAAGIVFPAFGALLSKAAGYIPLAGIWSMIIAFFVWVLIKYRSSRRRRTWSRR